MKGIRTLMPMLLAVALAAMPLRAEANTKSNTNMTVTANMKSAEEEIKTLLRKSSSEQSSFFARLINNNLKYATTRSYIGKDGKWLGFIDLYSEYKNGEPTGYVLERASVQYGTQSLPSDTVSCTLKIGDRTSSIEYVNRDTSFTFNTTPPIALSNSSVLSDPSFSIVSSGGRKTDIPMKLDYPGSSGISSVQQTLTSMASPYVDYIMKNGNRGFDHCVLRLKSYVSDSNSLARNYTWELILAHGESLPVKATVIRYDCTTGGINISQKDIRGYFS